MLWQFPTHADTHKHTHKHTHARTHTQIDEQDCAGLHMYFEMRVAVSYQSLAALADTAEAFYTTQNMISPGNTFSISCFWRETK